MHYSLVENLLQINRKLFLKLPWSLVSVSWAFPAGGKQLVMAGNAGSRQLLALLSPVTAAVR